MSEISADSRRLALEIIATLVNVKRSAAPGRTNNIDKSADL